MFYQLLNVKQIFWIERLWSPEQPDRVWSLVCVFKALLCVLLFSDIYTIFDLVKGSHHNMCFGFVSFHLLFGLQSHLL